MERGVERRFQSSPLHCSRSSGLKPNVWDGACSGMGAGGGGECLGGGGRVEKVDMLIATHQQVLGAKAKGLGRNLWGFEGVGARKGMAFRGIKGEGSAPHHHAAAGLQGSGRTSGMDPVGG